MSVEVATMLFTDLVGSTALQSSVSPEAADELRRNHFTVLRQAIADAGGVEVKNLGDGLMVVFGSASAALSCAVGMQQSVELDGRGRNLAIGLRVGLSAGEVTKEDGDYFGDPVIEAARLCAQCEGGQILATDLVRLMAGRRTPHSMTPRGEMALKGLPVAVEVVEVRWESLRGVDRGRSALPGMLIDRGQMAFAGREEEVATLRHAYDSASDATQVVFVVGEPGIGKTRVTAEFANWVVEHGGTVLAGRSDELVGAPYQPFVEALRWRIAQPGGVENMGSGASELVHLVPELAHVLPELRPALVSSPEAERLALFDGVREWLVALSAEFPVVLVLDDLQWADMGTYLLLRHIAVNRPVPKLTVVATLRNTELEQSTSLTDLVGELHRRGDVTRIDLTGLNAGEISDLMTRQAGHALDDSATALALALFEDTGGNPFFVGEALRHFAESGAIRQHDGRWVVAHDDSEPVIPEGIVQVVIRRVFALPVETQSLLNAASVIGTHFSIDLLAVVSGVNPDDALDDLEPALVAHLLIETGVGRYRFAHALVRTTLYSRLSTTRRSRVHRDVVRSLEKIFAGNLDEVVGELAYHWGEIGTVDARDPALFYARRAGDLAIERLAPDEATKWYRVALERLGGANSALEAQLLYDLGVAESTSEGPWQDTLLRAARAADVVGNVELMVKALCVDRTSGVQALHAAQPQKVALIERALTLSRNRVAETVELTLALSRELLFTGDVVRRTELFVEAMTLAESISDLLERARVTTTVYSSFALFDRAYWERRELVDREALELAREARDYELMSRMIDGLFYATSSLGRGNLDDIIAEAEGLYAVFPSPLVQIQLLSYRFHLSIVRGDFAEVATNFEKWVHAAKLTRRFDPAHIAPTMIFQKLRETEGLASVLDVMRAHPLLARESGFPGPVSGMLVLALAESGHNEEAADMVGRYAVNGFADFLDDATLPITRPIWADAVALVGEESACRQLSEVLLPYHDIHHMILSWYGGSASRSQAVLASAVGDDNEADRWFATAIAEHDRVASPPWSARSRIDWAESLMRRGDVASARDLARSALDVIDSLDLRVSRGRAHALLA